LVLGKKALFVMMTVAAVIPHWNRRDLLQSLITSLRAQTRPPDEIIVVDNGSTDDSAALAESMGARVVRLAKNWGFAVAVNRGIELARTDWVAILNNDVTLAPDWIEKLLSGAERANAWFAAGKIVRTSDPSIIDGAFDEISRGACACRCGAGKPDGPIWNQPRRIRFAPMTAALFRHETFDRVGPLDESFGSYLEDVDFGIRCAVAGLDGIYEPAGVAQHRGSSTLGTWNSDTVRLISRNQCILASKHFQGQARWPILAGQLLWGAVALRHGKGVAYFRGKISGLRFPRAVRLEHPGTNRVALRAIFEASERDIFELEQQTGSSWYWRAYFWLQRR
jgi:N-acetylglucosaminyl-diphospho-decaprenol L-rhamnosyltransferase